MNFNSVQFLLFFPLVLVFYRLVFSHERARTILLLVASYVFYMSWNWRYAGLILFSTMVDYAIGRVMNGTVNVRGRKALLTASLVLNLGLLGYFKYNNFFVESIGEVFTTLGFNADLSSLSHSYLLPVGISFYTFQSLSYTIDLYRKAIPVETSLPRFALYVAFFPQLVAGPIVRAAEFLPQLRRTPQVSSSNTLSGIAQMFRGLFKKIVFADLLAGLGVDTVFANPSEYSSLTLLLALYGYSFQIYNDFSGYSDIAIGAARVMGFHMPENFNRPYLSQNVREFWTRWHISLSTWLRDYLYIPLGGNRSKGRRVSFNLMMTMLLGGLWHGAAANFVVWGGWHGLLLILARRTPRHGNDSAWPVVFARRALCFHLVAVSWLLFRIGSMGDLSDYLFGLARFTFGAELSTMYVGVLGLAALVHFLPKQLSDRGTQFVAKQPVVVQGVAYAGLITVFAGLSFGAPAFIYFQF